MQVNFNSIANRSQNPAPAAVVARPNGGTCTGPTGPVGPGNGGFPGDPAPSACVFFGWSAWLNHIGEGFTHCLHFGHEVVEA